ncbi:cobaltochelatase subunit CobN [Xinfangfangia sp. D13-10-4-6]|uniref:cobaltochelatase subunit CobN n=1 Tax=Pseudogemmobacter hezensis TaxID=2737662 RepID=UPI001554A542|nr:cobaltochelatase subunit CobN [Pseudogemmobacter hezensis]NPD16558.1 cobaltochelatase subunit CobN [Pseudogemmobacter hezensis]
MHVLFRESHGLEESDTPQDLGQTPADLVVLSFSDSDLGAFAAGWRRGRDSLPALRLANLSRLTHPLSVDTYIEQTLSGARGILIRLIGGVNYWAYGVEQVANLARQKGIALALLPADGRPDPGLDAASTLPVSTLRRLAHLCEAGGGVAAQGALAQLALAAGLYAGPVPGVKTLPPHGLWHPSSGTLTAPPAGEAPLVVIPFYRAWAASGDTAAVDALIGAFEAGGFRAIGAFLPSLKEPSAAAWLRDTLPELAPAAIVNATAFSARMGDASPLDAAGVPVFQVIHATSTRAAWATAERGLSPADLAMHVALPEVDGRITAGVISFKDEAPRDPDLQFSRMSHAPDPERIGAVVAKVKAWIHLAQQPPAQRRISMVLSTYPGKTWRMAHAVGLDVLASAQAIAEDLSTAGFTITPGPSLSQALQTETITFPLQAYREALARLPEALKTAITETYGPPEDDPAIAAGAFHFHATRRGNLLIALQPERSHSQDREGDYHDTTRIPCHAYAAFYLWLQTQSDALVHLGAHGTLEWLPGKAVALSATCWPEALTAPLPVIYPFIVNDPGEAAQARRRIGALTLGHLTPPLTEAEMPAALARLERLLDEYSTADGLDPARRDRLIASIRQEARIAHVEQDLDIPEEASAAEAIPRIDRFLCDLKESQFGEGLHIWGRGTPTAPPFHRSENTPGGQFSAIGGADSPRRPATGDPASLLYERENLAAALSGKPIPPGPSGSPTRGRQDVLPTGRNLYGTDPRAVPSRAAHAQGIKLAEELIRRHLQDHGDYPRGLMLNLWGSATMRTAGEEFAMALHLAGLKPVWDEGSDRVTGYEIVPLALLDRPRIEVSIRASGLFRDVFPELSRLFDAACTALAQRDEAADMNPYITAMPGARVFAPAPGSYGLGIRDSDYSEAARKAAGEAWLAASDHSAAGLPAREVLEARLRGADAFLHAQDMPETDLLLAMDYASHEGGFAAAMAQLGAASPALYHLDATRPDQPRARALGEEIARVTRARAANPVWLQSMTRHGFRGAAEIAATLEHLAAFAHLARVVPAHLFDLYRAATLDDPEIRAFIAGANPEALSAMEDCFRALEAAGLWQSRSNSRAAGVV